MATPADQRLLELLDKWLKSLELHVKYSSLDDATYWNIQPWTEHQRPSRWILDLAKQKTQALRTQVQERMAAGDGTFSDSLELMTFLANLVGSEHIERFIPVADAQNERSVRPAAPEQQTGASGTIEMPKFLAAKRAVPPGGTAHLARAERKPPAVAGAAKAAKPPAKQAAKPKANAHAARDQVIADAARLMQWGRKWFELPELIARMADRPPLPEVRRILKENKSSIDEKAAER